MSGWSRVFALGACVGLSLGLSGCVTRALLRLGDPDDPPAAYDRLAREGAILRLHYSAVLHDDEVKPADDDEEVDLANLAWRSVAGGEMDAACAPASWARLTDEAPVDVPMVSSRPMNEKDGAAVHESLATGAPPMTVQFDGMDFRVFCGRGAGVAYAEVVHPPVATGKPAGAVTAIVFLFPLALLADMCGGFIGYFVTK